MTGLKFGHLSINDISKDFLNISIFIDGKEVGSGRIHEILAKITVNNISYSELCEYTIESTNMYFETFVIRLSSEIGKVHPNNSAPSAKIPNSSIQFSEAYPLGGGYAQALMETIFD